MYQPYSTKIDIYIDHLAHIEVVSLLKNVFDVPIMCGLEFNECNHVVNGFTMFLEN